MWIRTVLFLASTVLEGCLVLPVPQRVVAYPTVTGRLAYAETGQPVSGAVVSIGRPGSAPFTTANEQGEFEIVAAGWRFPYTSALVLGDQTAVSAQIWATVGSGSSKTSKQIGRVVYYPPTFSDPGSRNCRPIDLGLVQF